MLNIPGNKYQTQIRGTAFLIDKRYTNLSVSANWRSRVVVSAYDNNLKKRVFIEKVTNALEYGDLVKQSMNTINLPMLFDHQNILKVYSYDLIFSTEEKTVDIYIVTEYAETNLWGVIMSQQLLTDDHYKYFMFQLLRGLYQIHSSGIIHGSINPHSICINSNCDLKITEFHSSFTNFSAHWSEDYQQGLHSNFGYSPEYILGMDYCTTKHDVWSVGWLFLYMMKRENSLFSVWNHKRFIDIMLELLGKPSEDDMYFLNSWAYDYVIKLPANPRKNWKETLPLASDEALDLLDKMLVFNPNKRWDVSKCLQHPYFAELFENDDSEFRDREVDLSYLDLTYSEVVNVFQIQWKKNDKTH